MIWNISVSCPAGKYRSAEQTECQVCQENHVSEQGAGSCRACQDGTVANAEKTGCGMNKKFKHVLTYNINFKLWKENKISMSSKFCLSEIVLK